MQQAILTVLLIGFASSNRELWEVWKWKYNKVYNSLGDDETRYAIWRKTVDQINAHNLRYSLGLETWEQGVNHLTDMTHDEVIGSCVTPPLDQANDRIKLVNFTNVRSEIPESFDWREHGAVTDPKQQSPEGGSCGSCYTFATAGMFEGQYFRKTGIRVDLSSQQLLSCTRPYGNNGCKGGNPEKCYHYLREHKMEPESAYPYVGKETPCQHDDSKGLFYASSKQIASPQYDEYSLAGLIAWNGPASVLMTYMPDLNHYKSGVYNPSYCSQFSVNHGVLAVGYGTAEKGGDYWIIKNSHGPGYGLGGYFLLARNADNKCGIATYPTIALIAD